MNKIFTSILAGSTAPLDPQSRTLFISECSDLLDRLIKDLGEHSKNIQSLMATEYAVTHDFQRFAYKFDPEDERTSIGEFASTLSSVGHMGNTMCTMLEGRKKEIDGQLRRASEMRERFNAYLRFSRGKNPSDPAVLNAFDSLKFDFTSEILDQCTRIYGGQFKFFKKSETVLEPAVNTRVSAWNKRCCVLQECSREVRKCAAPMSGDCALTRGSSTPVFKTPLDKIPLIPGYHIPQILFDASEALLTIPGALEQEGLFRISPDGTELKNLKAACDQGKNIAIWNCAPHTIAGVIKLWFRELPDSVIPARIGVKFAAAAQDDPLKIKALLSELPEVNRLCLHKLMEVGHHVAQHSDKNLMTAENLAIVFGPNIIRREDELNPLTQVANLINLATNMLKNYDTIFGPFKGCDEWQ